MVQQARRQEIMAAKQQEMAEARAARAQASMMNMGADSVNPLNQAFGATSVGNMMADLIKMQAQALARSAQFQQSPGLFERL